MASSEGASGAPPAEVGPRSGNGEVLAEIDALTRSNREQRDPQVERRLLKLRHLAGASLLSDPTEGKDAPEPAFDRLPQNSDLPEIAPDDLTGGLLRAAILRNGCLLVRGLVAEDRALGIAEEIEDAFRIRDAVAAGEADSNEYYEEFEPDPPFAPIGDRPWIERGEACWRSTRRGSCSMSSRPSRGRGSRP